MKDLGTQKLETENLILRKLEVEDYKAAFKNWCSNPLVSKHLPWAVHKDEQETYQLFEMWVKEYEKPFTFRWIVIEKASDEAIGTIDVVNFKERDSRAEIGYCYGEKWWGKGYGTEALKRVLDYLLNEIEVELVVAGFEVSNPASGRCMEKAGMEYACLMPEWTINKEGKRESLKYYKKIKNQ